MQYIILDYMYILITMRKKDQKGLLLSFSRGQRNVIKLFHYKATDHKNCIEFFFGQIDLEKLLFGIIILVIDYC